MELKDKGIFYIIYSESLKDKANKYIDDFKGLGIDLISNDDEAFKKASKVIFLIDSTWDMRTLKSKLYESVDLKKHVITVFMEKVKLDMELKFILNTTDNISYREDQFERIKKALCKPELKEQQAKDKAFPIYCILGMFLILVLLKLFHVV